MKPTTILAILPLLLLFTSCMDGSRQDWSDDKRYQQPGTKQYQDREQMNNDRLWDELRQTEEHDERAQRRADNR